MTLAASLGATALTLIERYGKVATFVSIAEGLYDASTGKPATFETSATVRTFMSSITDRRDESTSKGRSYAFIAAKALLLKPAINDILRAGSIDWTVEAVLEHEVQGTPVLYQLVVRRA